LITRYKLQTHMQIEHVTSQTFQQDNHTHQTSLPPSAGPGESFCGHIGSVLTVENVFNVFILVTVIYTF